MELCIVYAHLYVGREQPFHNTEASNAHVKRELIQGCGLNGIDGERAIRVDGREPAAHYERGTGTMTVSRFD